MKNGRKGRDIAILYRTNAQSRILEEIMIESCIPYIIVGGLKFYERKEIKDMMAYVKASLHPEDDINLRRIINVPHRGIGAVTLKSVEEYAGISQVSLYDGVKVSADNPG
jgi:DNA helicase-2/ATP-dependent DNA helicase PcrA